MNNYETGIRFVIDNGGRFVIDKYLFKAVCMVHVPFEYMATKNRDWLRNRIELYSGKKHLQFYFMHGTNIIMFERKFPFRIMEEELTQQLEKDVKNIMWWTAAVMPGEDKKGYISIKSYYCSV